MSKELAGIRKRRNTDSKRRFPSAIEDWTLLAGIGYGALYTLLLFGMSGGVFGESTSLDHWASGTFLDSGEQCEEVKDTPWIHVYPDNDAESLEISGRNLKKGNTVLNWTVSVVEEGTPPDPYQKEVQKRSTQIKFSDWDVGIYEVTIKIDIYNSDANMSNMSEWTDEYREESVLNGTKQIEKIVEFKLQPQKMHYHSYHL